LDIKDFFVPREKPKPYRQISPLRVMQLAKEYGFTLLVVPDGQLDKEEKRVIKTLLRNEIYKIRWE